MCPKIPALTDLPMLYLTPFVVQGTTGPCWERWQGSSSKTEGFKKSDTGGSTGQHSFFAIIPGILPYVSGAPMHGLGLGSACEQNLLCFNKTNEMSGAG